MAKILVIPDTHLKPKMFDLANEIMREYEVDYAIQLGDNLDDFYCYDDQYRRHYARMLSFYHEHSKTIWLWGNHEASYILDKPVTGNIHAGKEYARLFRKKFNPKIAHLDGRVVFSHAGIFQEFIEGTRMSGIKTVEELCVELNKLELSRFWRNDSPLWGRPQYDELNTLGLLKDYIQIVGHTPMKNISEKDGIVSVDVFSTNWGRKIGVEKMVIVDTNKASYEVIEIDYRRKFGEDR